MASKNTMYKLSVSGASGTDDSSGVVRGAIKAIFLDYSASAAATTDVDIKDAWGQTILDIDNANTDGVFYPRTPAQDHLGADVTYDGTNEIYVPFEVFSRLTLTVAQNSANESVTAFVLVEEY